MALRTATITATRMLTPDVRELTLDAGDGFAFVPGQWVSLRIPAADGSVVARSYSIASAPEPGGRFDLAVTRVENGPGSTWLHAAGVGAAVPVADAAGFFTLPEPPPRAVLMVATGTGVAPFRAMLQAMLARGMTTRVTLLLGVRTEADALYAGEFREAAAAHPGFRFELTLSRADAAWGGRRGYVQEHAPELARDLGDCDLYACGLSAMVRDVRAVAKSELGFGRERIHTERYD